MWNSFIKNLENTKKSGIFLKIFSFWYLRALSKTIENYCVMITDWIWFFFIFLHSIIQLLYDLVLKKKNKFDIFCSIIRFPIINFATEKNFCLTTKLSFEYFLFWRLKVYLIEFPRRLTC